MDVAAALEEMSEFAQLVSARLATSSSHLRSAWTTYSNEAAWGRQYLDEELQRLSPGARILEVGAGTYALSGQLAREGFDVTGLEPVGLGFGTMEALGRLVGSAFEELGVRYGRLPLMAEDLTDIEEYDFAFSINVLEHVRDVETVLTRTVGALRPGGRLRFRCPNYDFPYEPHFGWLVPPNKALADRVCVKRLEHVDMEDPAGLWASLNWVNVRQVRAWADRQDEAHLLLNPDALFEIWERAKSDPVLMQRHRGPLTAAVTIAERVGASRLIRLVPVEAQPLIDALVIKGS